MSYRKTGMKKYISVIGGINIDIKGIADSGKEERDSYKGKILFTPGGVARNISENLARLGVKVYLLGTVGDDHFGNYVIKETKKAGVITNLINKSKSTETAKYLSVSSTDKKIFYAVNDMKKSSEKTDANYIRENKEIIENSSMVIIDLNLKRNVLEEIIKLSRRKQIPVFADAVSSEKAVVFKKLNDRIDYLSVNENEFKSLFGVTYKTNIYRNNQFRRNIKNFKNIILKKGSSGVSLLDTSEGSVLNCKALKTKVTEPNGAGDSFNAGFIFAMLNGYSDSDALKIGTCASFFTLRSGKSVSESINSKMIINLFQKKSQSNEF